MEPEALSIDGRRPPSSVVSSAAPSSSAHRRTLSAVDYIRRHTTSDGKLGVPSFTHLKNKSSVSGRGGGCGKGGAASPRPFTTNSIRSSPRASAPHVSSEEIGREAWRRASLRPRTQQANMHHLAPSALGHTIHEEKEWDGDHTRYREEYPEVRPALARQASLRVPLLI
jgi:hypothetical protein